MKRLAIKTSLLAAASAGLFGAATAFDYAAEGKLWWAHIQYLADDGLQGRNVGTEGFHKAVQYVSAAFERNGLKPAGTSGYLQPIRFESRLLIEEQSNVTLVRDGKEEQLEFGADATLSPRAALPASITAPMVFAGYGMRIPEAHYDDLGGLDLKGKVAVYVSAPGPAEAPGPLKSHYSSAVERWSVLRKAGAIGVVTIPNPRTATGNGRGGPGEGEAAEAGTRNGNRGATGASQQPEGGRGGARAPVQPAIILADASLQETVGQSIALALTSRGAERLFAGSDHKWAELEKLARANLPLPRFAIPGTLRIQATVRHEPLESTNVAGMIPGADRKLKDQYVILSAHLDHVGVGRAVKGDSIYNGAMDDASGIATLLEVARLMNESGARPKRSVIFLAVTAEEKGELGSRYFAAHPTVPVKQIVADINLDMFLPLYPLRYLEVQGLAESTLGETVREAAKELGVEVQADNEPEQNRFIRSDQYSFIRRGIPALAFKFGYAAGSREEQIRREWIRDRYHRPSDDLTQPVDTAAAALFNRVIKGLLERVADAPERPRWHDESFFKRFAK
jgi:hypothetical protein